MTAEQLARMSDEQKRIALAKFMGWLTPGCDGDTPSVPDYLNDLNAIAEVEAKLSDSQYTFFASGLDDLVNEADRRSDSLYFVANRTVSATARQRADAILMIL